MEKSLYGIKVEIKIKIKNKVKKKSKPQRNTKDARRITKGRIYHKRDTKAHKGKK